MPFFPTSRPVIHFLIASAFFLSAPASGHGEDDPLLLMALADQLEVRDIGDSSVVAWDLQGWLGKDLQKLWIKSEGRRESGTTDDAELQLLYSHALATYWDVQAGIRHDFKPSPSRSWAAIGVKGLAPYFFEIDATAFIGEGGHSALRIEAEYELLLTQRLILTPDVEINFFGKDDPATGTGSGLSEIEGGLRLRYELRREFAPYVGINWSRLSGQTADFARAAGHDASDTQFVIGIRAWY